MAKPTRLVYKVKIDAPQNTIFQYLADWEKQSEWIALTKVSKVSDGNNEVGTKLHAWTGLGPIGFLDTMTVTRWDPPNNCTVLHTGKVVKGEGIFSVTPISETSSEFVWEEVTPIPFGFIGKAGFVLVSPFINFMFKRSLNKLKNNIEKQA